MSHKIHMLLVILELLAAAVFAILFYAQYFKWRACFNDQGRCFDAASGTVYNAQSGIGWGILTLISTALAIVHLRAIRR